MSYELYPVHCLYHGDIISDSNYNKLSAENKKRFAKSERPVNSFISEDKDDEHLSICELYPTWKQRIDKENNWMKQSMPDNIQTEG